MRQPVSVALCPVFSTRSIRWSQSNDFMTRRIRGFIQIYNTSPTSIHFNTIPRFQGNVNTLDIALQVAPEGTTTRWNGSKIQAANKEVAIVFQQEWPVRRVHLGVFSSGLIAKSDILHKCPLEKLSASGYKFYGRSATSFQSYPASRKKTTVGTPPTTKMVRSRVAVIRFAEEMSRDANSQPSCFFFSLCPSSPRPLPHPLKLPLASTSLRSTSPSLQTTVFSMAQHMKNSYMTVSRLMGNLASLGRRSRSPKRVR